MLPIYHATHRHVHFIVWSHDQEEQKHQHTVQLHMQSLTNIRQAQKKVCEEKTIICAFTLNNENHYI